MTPAMIFLTVLLAAAVFLLMVVRLGGDLVAVFILLALLFSGILTVGEAFAGFGSPGVVAVAALFVVSGGLRQTGVSGLIGRQLMTLCRRGEAWAVVTVMAAGALLSSVISNVAAAAILLPAVMALGHKSELAPSRLLIPLAYGTILGGMLTIIGSQPNIIAGSAFLAATGKDLGFFALTPAGLILTALGIGYMAFIGRRFLPVRPMDTKTRGAIPPEKLPSIYRLDERLYELKVLEGKSLAGKSLRKSDLGQRFGINVIGIARFGESRFSPSGKDLIHTGDRLLVQGRKEDVEAAARDFGLEVVRREYLRPEELLSKDIGVAELVLPPRSSYVGQTLGDIRMRERLGLTVLGIWRGGKPIRAHLGEERLQFGDALLVRGAWDRIRWLASSEEFILVSETDVPEQRRPRIKMLTAGGILTAMIAAAASGVLPVSLSALAAAGLMILTRCLDPADAYRAIEWRLVIMIGGFLSFGAAMAKTGLVEVFVSGALIPIANGRELFVLGAVFLLSSLLALAASHITSAVLMIPVALQAAFSLSLDPGTLLIAVILGSSSGFLTPIAQQSNLLVMGAGNYTPADYVKAGLGLSLFVFAAVLVFLPLLRGL
ncbi:MAG: SLC13 family permease [Candidatus Aminicenantes bacterium]